MVTSQRLDISHVDHGLAEAFEELVLAGSEEVDDFDGVFAGSGMKDLVTGEKAGVGLKVCVVVLVELVGSRGVQIHKRVSAATASLTELLCIPGIQRAIWI